MPTTPRREPRFVVELATPFPPAELWRRLWDLERHTAAVPLTVVRPLDGAPLREGARFVARTGAGPLHLDDGMVVVDWAPPHRAVIRKTGPWLTGGIEARVEPTATGSRLLWTQSYGARGVPAGMASLVRAAVRAGYATALRRILGIG